MKHAVETNLLKSALDGLGFSVWVVDSSYELLYCNQTFQAAYTQIHKVPVACGHRLLDDLSAEEHLLWSGLYDRALSGESFEIDLGIERDIPETSFIFRFRPYVDLDGSNVGCIVTAVDSTAMSVVINKLKSDERKLESIVNNTDDIIMLIDKDMNILHFNHGLSLLVENRWGFKLAPGMHVSQIIEPGYTEIHMDLYARGLSGEQFSQIEEYRNVNDEAVFIETSYNPVFEEDGSVSSLAIHSRDITLRKLAELELIKSKEQAEELSRLKTNFLANMSHEIRTPINGILGLAEIMAVETDINNIKEYTLYLQESGRRLLNTITSILDVSKLEAEGSKLKLEPVSVEVVVSEVIKLLHPIAKKKGIYLDLVKEDGNCTVLADRTMMSQIFTNIIGNAVKFTLQGGVSIEINQEKGSGFVVVSVIDTGVGISEEFLPKLFNVFEQESSGTGRSFEGTGLGLSITNRFVGLIGGNISVSSKKNVGTTFEIRLPTYKLVN